VNYGRKKFYNIVFRTVGVLTKIDLEKEPVKVESLVRTLENRTLPLIKGYIGVINHSQEQVSVQKA